MKKEIKVSLSVYKLDRLINEVGHEIWALSLTISLWVWAFSFTAMLSRARIWFLFF